MRRISALLGSLCVLLALALVPVHASAQGLSIAPKIGSGGVGADVAFGLTDRLSARGGIGFIPIEFEDIDLDGNDFDVTTPDFFATVGLDFKVAGPLRLMGGILFRSGDFEYGTDIETEIEINDQTYTGSGRFAGAWENKSTAPFVGIGLGHVAGSGFGIFLDAGVAFTGDPEVTGVLSGPIAASVPPAEVAAEVAAINDDIPSYAQYWPFVQLGFRIGLN